MKANELRALSDCHDSTELLFRSATATRGFWARVAWAICVSAAVLAGSAGISGCASSWEGSVGAVLSHRKSDGRVYIRAVPEDMAGYRGGLREGDEVVSIDDKPVALMQPAEVTKALRGRVGTKVNLVVLRGSDRLNVTVQRGPFKESKK